MHSASPATPPRQKTRATVNLLKENKDLKDKIGQLEDKIKKLETENADLRAKCPPSPKKQKTHVMRRRSMDTTPKIWKNK